MAEIYEVVIFTAAMQDVSKIFDNNFLVCWLGLELNW